MDPLTQAQLAEIKRDITAFADPGTEVMVGTETLMWEKDGRGCEAEILQGTEPQVRIDGATMLYGRFIGSHHMADLPRLAEFIRKTMPPPEDPYVAAAASGPEDETSLTHDLISRSTLDLPHGSTRIVLVQGEAGSGKTVTLRHMTRKRADNYSQSDDQPLFFYIDVQGRALSRLDDAMARDLQDLRSRFSYNAVPSLVRNRLLIPIIDGFDELLGSGGYDEAFSSLAAFVSQLNGRGALVASARATFFDYNNFRENAERYSQDDQVSYEIFPVRIKPWKKQDAERFVRKKSGRNDVVSAFAKLRRGMNEADKTLLCKPFYVAQLTTMLMDPEAGMDGGSGEPVLDRFIEAFVRRERSKLRTREGRALLSAEQHYGLLGQLAEEMWWLEERQLDVDTVQTVADLFAEDIGASTDDARSIRERVVTHAMLVSGGSATGGDKYRRFEHDVFFSYFLAKRLRQHIDQDRQELRRFLRRSVLDEVSVECTARLYGQDIGSCSKATSAICSALTTGMIDAVARENGGRLVAQLIKDGRMRPGIVMRNLYFHRSDFGDARLKWPVFRRCQFIRVDFTQARLESPLFEDCTFQVPLVDLETTRFDGADPVLATAIKGNCARRER